MARRAFCFARATSKTSSPRHSLRRTTQDFALRLDVKRESTYGPTHFVIWLPHTPPLLETSSDNTSGQQTASLSSSLEQTSRHPNRLLLLVVSPISNGTTAGSRRPSSA